MNYFVYLNETKLTRFIYIHSPFKIVPNWNQFVPAKCVYFD